MRIIVNRTSSPVHDINFMNVEGKKQGFIYTDAMQLARHWHGLMEVLIKRSDSEDAAKGGDLVFESTPAITNRSIADELTKLSELKKQGLLTDEEFSAEKAKLLSYKI